MKPQSAPSSQTAMTPLNIPLHCSICPKKPNFSDVSHLLTHIASKGHLSHYYKVKVKSGQEIDSRVNIEAYDQWYYENGIEQLMFERMETKEKKKLGKMKDPSRWSPQKPQRKQKPKQQDVIDPSLSGPTLPFDSFLHDLPEIQPKSIFDLTFPYVIPPLHKPRLHWWDTQTPTSFSATPLGSFSSSPSQSTFGFDRAGLDATSLTKGIQGYEVDNSEPEDEMTRLKGTLWPGMDVFDAATPRTKRKRNQKKGVSVVERLEHNADEVEPTEMVFTPLGTLKKARMITGQVDWDSSPLKIHMSTPPPALVPKRRASRRAPLANMDINGTLKSHQDRGIANLVSNTDFSNAKESRQASRQLGKRQKNIFSAFNDDDNPPFGNSQGLNMLNSGFGLYPQAKSISQNVLQTLATQPSVQYHPSSFADGYHPEQHSFFSMPYYPYFGPFAPQDMHDIFTYATMPSYAQANSAVRSGYEKKGEMDHDDSSPIYTKPET